MQIESRRISRDIFISKWSKSVMATSLYDFNYVILGEWQNYGYNEKMRVVMSYLTGINECSEHSGLGE